MLREGYRQRLWHIEHIERLSLFRYNGLPFYLHTCMKHEQAKTW